MSNVVIYSSSNGDHWVYLPDEKPPAVEHLANLASGGRVSRQSVEEFLLPDRMGPEHQALRKILAEADKGEAV